MDNLQALGVEILDIAQKIFEFNEQNNPQIIIGGKIFYFNKDENGIERITVYPDYEDKDKRYYFELPELSGVILKKSSNGTYEVKARISYMDRKGEKWAFSKIRIGLNFDGKIGLYGNRSGNWQNEDYYDTNFLENPDYELDLVLETFKSSLTNMWDELHKNCPSKGDEYSPDWVRQIKPYNK